MKMLGEQARVLLEPALRLTESRAQAFHFAPKAAGVVHFFQVGEFVQHEVVAHEDRSLHQAPVEGDGAAPGAGAPAGALVAHRYAPRGQLVQCGQLKYAPGQFLRRQLPQMPLDHRAEVAVRIRDRHGFAAKAD